MQGASLWSSSFFRLLMLSSIALELALAMAVSGALGLITVWVSITASFWSNWPIGFFVGTFAVGVVRDRALPGTMAQKARPGEPLELAGAGSR